MVRPILRYGEPLLHDVAAPVAPDAVTAPATRALIDDLLDTLRNARGVGLAAPQVGVRQRVCVVDVSGGQRAEDLLVLVNPAFEARDGLQLELEGCLSLPGVLQHEIDHLDGVLFVDRLPAIARRLLLRRLARRRRKEGW
jgi:peptide deformylase